MVCPRLLTKSLQFSLFQVLVFGAVTVLCCYHGSSKAQTKLYIPPIREVMHGTPKNPYSVHMGSDEGSTNPALNLDGTASDPAVSAYIQSVVGKIERMPFSWPNDQNGNRVYGEAEVVLKIGSDGALLSVSTRGNPTLGSTVVDMAKRAAPFFPPPPSILHGQNSVQFSRLLVLNKGSKKPNRPQKPPRIYEGGPGPVTVVKRR